ncbi:MAG: cyclic nucleotide-binding domain-containing protein [Myxococcota bacterium]
MSVDLAKFELLEELSEEQREALGDALSESTLEPDQALFHCRDEASELHLICEGGVRLELNGRELGELHAGESLGAASLAIVGNRQCDAYAIGKTRLFTLTRTAYLCLCSDTPSVALALQEGVLRAFAGFLRCTVSDRRDSPL